MTITFNPPFGEQTTLALPTTYAPDADIELTFHAFFDSPVEVAQIRNGARIEMWTNLPVVGRAQGEWGALVFSPEHGPAKPDLALPKCGPRTFAISPDSSLKTSSGTTDLNVFKVQVKTRFVEESGRYNFTYRMVQPNGDIRWLGDFTRDGQLVVKRKDSRIKLDTTWATSHHGEATWKGDREAVIGALNSKLEWSVWVLDQDGFALFYESLDDLPEDITPSVLILLPSSSPNSILEHQPLILSRTSGNASISLLPSGQVVVHPIEPTTLSLRTFDGTWDLRAFAQDVIFSATGTRRARLVSLHPELGYAVVASPVDVAPVTVSLIPFTISNVSGTRPALVSSRTLASLLPTGMGPGVSLYASATGRLLVIPSADADNADAPVLLSAGRQGGQFFVAPTHTISSPSFPVEISMLAPHEVLPTPTSSPVEGTPGHLPSPPPTPPRTETPLPIVQAGAIPSPSQLETKSMTLVRVPSYTLSRRVSVPSLSGASGRLVRLSSDYVSNHPLVVSTRASVTSAALFVAEANGTISRVEGRPPKPLRAASIVRETGNALVRQPVNGRIVSASVWQLFRMSLLLCGLFFARLVKTVAPGLPGRFLPPSEKRGRPRTPRRRSTRPPSPADTTSSGTLVGPSRQHKRGSRPSTAGSDVAEKLMIENGSMAQPARPLALGFALQPGPALMLIRSLTRARPGETVSAVKLELDGKPVAAAWRPLDDGVIVKLVAEKEAKLKVTVDA